MVLGMQPRYPQLFVCCARHEHPGPQYTEPKIRPIESEPDIRYWVEGEVIERDVRRGMGEIRYKYCGKYDILH